jgi:hypothetical protein
MTARGAYLTMAAFAAIGCGLGFVLTGAVAIPTLAGWGLLAGSVLAGLLASPRAGWFPVALPPLAMLTVILVLGQLTLIGSRPTFVRELAMVVSNLTAMAPAQVVSVAAVAAILFVRYRRTSRRSDRGTLPG